MRTILAYGLMILCSALVCVVLCRFFSSEGIAIAFAMAMCGCFCLAWEWRQLDGRFVLVSRKLIAATAVNQRFLQRDEDFFSRWLDKLLVPRLQNFFESEGVAVVELRYHAVGHASVGPVEDWLECRIGYSEDCMVEVEPLGWRENDWTPKLERAKIRLRQMRQYDTKKH